MIVEVIQLDPCEIVAPHQHNSYFSGEILNGNVTVHYPTETKIYTTGDIVVEPINVTHWGQAGPNGVVIKIRKEGK